MLKPPLSLAPWLLLAAWTVHAEESPKKEAPVNPLAIQSLAQLVLYPKDIEATKAFYMDKLGFSLAYPFGGGPVKGYQLKAGEVGLTLLSIQGAPTTKVENLMIHVRVADADVSCKEIQAKGVALTHKLEDTDWGTRWFQVQDPDGLTLAFEQRKSKADPALRQLGEARIAVVKEAKTQEDFKRLWKEPKHPYPFVFGTCWKQCAEYTVDDFAAEVGFWFDVMGFQANAFSPDYAMFTGPKKDFFFSVVPSSSKRASTPPDAMRLEFMVEDIEKLGQDLEKRGIRFEHKPAPEGGEGSPMWKATFRTPHGIAVNLWCVQLGK